MQYRLVPGAAQPVAKRLEIWAWYAYGFSTGPFWGLGQTLLTVLVTDQAKRVAFSTYGAHYVDMFNRPCIPLSSSSHNTYSMNNSKEYGGYPRNAVWPADNNTLAHRPPPSSSCSLKPVASTVLFGVNYESFANLCVFISVTLQLLLFLSIGSFGDYGNLRKLLLVISNGLGAISMFIPLLFDTRPNTFWVGGIAIVLSSLMYNTAYIFFNAFLPLLSNRHYSLPHVVAEEERISRRREGGQGEGEAEPIEEMRRQDAVSKVAHETSFLGDLWLCLSTILSYAIGSYVLSSTHAVSSSTATATGTAAASSGTTSTATVLTSDLDKQEFLARLCCAGVGVFSLTISSVAFLFLHSRPGPPLPSPSPRHQHLGERENASFCARMSNFCARTLCCCCGWWTCCCSHFSTSYHNLRHTLQTCAQLPNTLLFLLSFTLLADGVSTLGTSLNVLAISELSLSVGETLLAMNVFTGASVLADVVFGYAVHFNLLSPKSIMLSTCALTMMVPLYVLVGLVHKYELYVVLAVTGFVSNPFWVFARSLFSSLIPPNQEAAFFSLYQITSNGTAWLGPLVVVCVQQATNNYRIAVSTISLFFLGGVILLWMVDFEAGREAARHIEHTPHHPSTNNDDDQNNKNENNHDPHNHHNNVNKNNNQDNPQHDHAEEDISHNKHGNHVDHNNHPIPTGEPNNNNNTNNHDGHKSEEQSPTSHIVDSNSNHAPPRSNNTDNDFYQTMPPNQYNRFIGPEPEEDEDDELTKSGLDR